MPLDIVLAATGAENISLEAISAVLKQNGHRVQVAFDRALFNDAQYFSIPWLARLFDAKDEVVRQIVAARPDLLCVSVFADNYQWALDLCRRVKREVDVTVVFGGIHPTTVPERVIREACVDVVCVGEGDYAIAELAASIERGRIEHDIPNLWFKRNGQVIRNPPRPNANLDELPMIDKRLFEDYIPYRHYYLTVTNRGCVRRCSFCSENFKEHWEHERRLGPFMRDQSVDKVIDELKTMRARYGLRYIDIKNNVLSGSKKWTLEFLRRYGAEIGLPFRIMGYPRLLTKEVVLALRAAGCHHIQMGIESVNEAIRRGVLLRPESNAQIRDALDNMDAAGIGYSTDFILGLPGESEQDLIDALRLLSGRRGLRRASIFWLEYLPGVSLTERAHREGLIGQREIEQIEEGRQEHYLAHGSVEDIETVRQLKSYHVLFRLLPITPTPAMDFVLRHRLQRLFLHVPQTPLIIAIDLFVSLIERDYYALWAIRTYLFEIKRRLRARLFGPSEYVYKSAPAEEVAPGTPAAPADAPTPPDPSPAALR
ncbi:cobalamin-dependent protein [Candidatus Binatia bacterium]|nr:cobalamin-dependent protein [Candidatus Binatia bacterium]